MGKRRFSRLDFALKANDGDAKVGSALDKYKKVSTGETTLTYTRDQTDLPGELLDHYLFPFADPDDVQFLVTMSTRANDNLSSAGVTLGDLNISATASGTAEQVVSNLFTPARASITVASGTVETKTSKITGFSYKRKADTKTYSYPFGRSSGALSTTNNYAVIATAIKDAVEAGATDRTVSFSPEQFRI